MPRQGTISGAEHVSSKINLDNEEFFIGMRFWATVLDRYS